jgi:hypothetical protein
MRRNGSINAAKFKYSSLFGSKKIPEEYSKTLWCRGLDFLVLKKRRN